MNPRLFSETPELVHPTPTCTHKGGPSLSYCLLSDPSCSNATFYKEENCTTSDSCVTPRAVFLTLFPRPVCQSTGVKTKLREGGWEARKRKSALCRGVGARAGRAGGGESPPGTVTLRNKASSNVRAVGVRTRWLQKSTAKENRFVKTEVGQKSYFKPS